MRKRQRGRGSNLDKVPPALRPFLGPIELKLSPADARRLRAEGRWRQSWWLRLKLAEMQDCLEQLGLPRRCWRQLWIPGLREDEPDLRFPAINFTSQPPGHFCFADWIDAHWETDAAHAGEALWAAAVAWTAHQARTTRDPEQRFVCGRMLEAFDANRRFPEIGHAQLAHLLAEHAAQHGRDGGHAGAGKAKRPHTDLIRRAVTALAEKHLEVSAANVRLLLKSGWHTLAFEWGDPLYDIVDVTVREQGPVEIEYTERWATQHKGTRFVRLGAGALSKALKRATEPLSVQRPAVS
jgi:hypothetical protein